MKRVRYYWHDRYKFGHVDDIYVEEKDFTKNEIIQQIKATYPVIGGDIIILETEDGWEPYVVEPVRYCKVR